jgi:ABC-2 type transport system ATP-binding protein
MTMDHTATIEASGVSKWYGNVVAVNDVSFEITPGITGLLGPNGAGKTTILHMLAGLAKTSEGEVTILGDAVRDNPDIYRRIGVMPEHDALYGVMSGRAFVAMAAKLHKLPDPESAVERAINAAGMVDAQDRPVRDYSRGMRQRIRLAATMVHDPEVLILDEPLSGTDPRQRIQFQELLRDLARDGRTILVSSHILEEVEHLADRILLMVGGKLAASGDFRAIRAKLNEQPYQIRVHSPQTRALAGALVEMEEVDSVSVGDDGSITFMTRRISAVEMAISGIAKERGIRLLRVEPLDDSLESVFSYVVER